MKAIVQDRYGSVDALELADIDKPVPKDNEVLLRVHAAGVDPSVWHLMTGTPYLVRLAFGVRRPKTRVRGWDVAGRVESVGAKVTAFRPGDEVFGQGEGSFAEYTCAREGKLVPKPSNLTFEQAAAVAVSGVTALLALRDKGRVRQGQQVLIIGAGGGVGTFAVQLAKAYGAHVTAVCSGTKTDLVRSIGADDVIDYTHDDFADGTRRFDLILDIAGLRSMARLRRALTPTGTIVLVGGEGGGRWTGGVQRNLGAAVVSLFRRQKVRGLFAAVRAENLQTMRELIEAGKVTPVIDTTYPLSDAAEAIRQWEQGHARGKAVITV
jgi:NADPH:quinone reductase-like Zn-dependent oxidoreductase